MPPLKPQQPPSAAVIGGGPAGLIAAQVLLANGLRVDLYERMPAPGRKFLVAGSSGLNLTRDEPFPNFLSSYSSRSAVLEPYLRTFGPEQVRTWLTDLGFPAFTGTSGRVFPQEMTAGRILHTWLQQLRAAGLQLHTEHHWQGWTPDGALRFSSPAGEWLARPDAVILALGGASWPQTGSDAGWLPVLAERAVPIAPLKPANCGFNVAWSDHLRRNFAGAPLKTVVLHFEEFSRRGEFVVTEYGVEGSLIYAAASRLRDAIERSGSLTIHLDLAPDFSSQELLNRLSRPCGKRSLSGHLARTLGFKGLKTALLYECLPKQDLQDLNSLAAGIKALPITLLSPRPIAEAISTAGGVRFEALDRNLMLTALPGVFCAGEMLDWEAPTGGYLLTACFSTGYAAAHGLLAWLQAHS